MTSTAGPDVADHPDVLSGLADVLADVAETDRAQVLPQASFADDLEVDSLLMVEVVMACEERFDVRLPDEALEEITTVGDAVREIVSRRQAPGAAS